MPRPARDQECREGLRSASAATAEQRVAAAGQTGEGHGAGGGFGDHDKVSGRGLEHQIRSIACRRAAPLLARVRKYPVILARRRVSRQGKRREVGRVIQRRGRTVLVVHTRKKAPHSSDREQARTKLGCVQLIRSTELEVTVYERTCKIAKHIAASRTSSTLHVTGGSQDGSTGEVDQPRRTGHRIESTASFPGSTTDGEISARRSVASRRAAVEDDADIHASDGVKGEILNSRNNLIRCTRNSRPKVSLDDVALSLQVVAVEIKTTAKEVQSARRAYESHLGSVDNNPTRTGKVLTTGR